MSTQLLAPTTAITLDAERRRRSDWKWIAFTGYAVILLTFGFAGSWAAVANIDQAIVAQALVSTETNRKSVQHYEGGIIRKIDVQEGASVKQGDVLFELETVQAQANSEILSRHLSEELALEARLIAERDDQDKVKWPADLDMNDPITARLVADQVTQYTARKMSLDNQVSILNAKIEQLETEIGGIEIEKTSTLKQGEYITKELVSLRQLLLSQLVTSSRVFAMERERTRLEGEVGKLISDAARAQGAIFEIREQVRQLKQKFREEVGTSLLECRQKIAEVRQRLAIASDVLRREIIVAPRSGTVQTLRVFTVGQVVKPGESLLEIVPENEPLMIQARISPIDIDSVQTGQTAEIRFPSFHTRQLPFMKGTLQSLSHDRLSDESGGKDESKGAYYLGRIEVRRADIPEPYRSRIRPGMPAEVLVKAGERTVLQYLVSPLSSSLRKTFIEK